MQLRLLSFQLATSQQHCLGRSFGLEQAEKYSMSLFRKLEMVCASAARPVIDTGSSGCVAKALSRDRLWDARRHVERLHSSLRLVMKVLEVLCVVYGWARRPVGR